MRGPPGDPLATPRCSVSRRGSDDPDDRGAVREWLAFPGDRRSDKLPGEVRPGRRTMTGELAACSWRIVPIPLFCERGEMWHDPATGAANGALIRGQSVGC